MAWLEDLLANLQSGGVPPGFGAAPSASPFPNPPPPVDEAAAAQAAREAAGARMVRANQRRVDPFGMPDVNSAGIQLALDQAPAGTGVPVAPGTSFAPMSIALPPSVTAAKSMAAPPAPAPQAGLPGMMPPGAVPGMPAGPGPAREAPEDGPTDVSSRGRAPAPMVAPMSLAPAAPAAEPSFLSRLSEGAKSMAPGLLAAGAALQGDNSVAATMLANQEKKALLGQQQTATARALLQRGAAPEEIQAAIGQPDLMKALITKYFETKPAQNVGNRLVRERPDGKIDVLADFSKDEEKKPPTGFEKRADGTLHFIKGGPADPEYLREKGERNAAPAGYRWNDPKDPDKGLTAIPGGPGEKVDAEVAGRLGLAKSFLGQLPEIRKRVEAGELTGPVGAIKATLGAGGPGEIRRQVDSGAEALLRMLTGAGMNKDEAANYVRRYQFSPTDTIPTVLSKLNQLERELNSVGETVGKGRGGWNPPKAPAAGTIDVGGKKIQWKVD